MDKKKINLINFDCDWKIEEEDESKFESNISKSCKKLDNPLLKINDKLLKKNKKLKINNYNNMKKLIETKIKEYMNTKIKKIFKDKNHKKLILYLNELGLLTERKLRNKNKNINNQKIKYQIKYFNSKIDSLWVSKKKIVNCKSKSKLNSVRLNLNNIINNKKVVNKIKKNTLNNKHKNCGVSNKTIKQKQIKKKNYFNKEIKDTIDILKVKI